MPTNPDTLFQEANCFRCNSNASEADLLELALLDRISTAASSDSTPGLPLTSVQFNDGGVFGGDADLTWNKTTNLLSIVGGISMTAEANETPFTISGYSLTGANAQSALSIAGTWNTSGTPTLLSLDLTNTASNAASLAIGYTVNSVVRFSVRSDGRLFASAGSSINSGVNEVGLSFYQSGVQVSSTGRFSFGSGASGASPDVALSRNAAGIIEVNNNTPGTFRTIQAILKTSVNATASGALVNTHTIPITDASGTVYRCLCLV